MVREGCICAGPATARSSQRTRSRRQSPPSIGSSANADAESLRAVVATSYRADQGCSSSLPARAIPSDRAIAVSIVKSRREKAGRGVSLTVASLPEARRGCTPGGRGSLPARRSPLRPRPGGRLPARRGPAPRPPRNSAASSPAGPDRTARWRGTGGALRPRGRRSGRRGADGRRGCLSRAGGKAGTTSRSRRVAGSPTSAAHRSRSGGCRGRGGSPAPQVAPRSRA